MQAARLRAAGPPRKITSRVKVETGRLKRVSCRPVCRPRDCTQSHPPGRHCKYSSIGELLRAIEEAPKTISPPDFIREGAVALFGLCFGMHSGPSCLLASLAPSDNASSLAQAIYGWMRPPRPAIGAGDNVFAADDLRVAHDACATTCGCSTILVA